MSLSCVLRSPSSLHSSLGQCLSLCKQIKTLSTHICVFIVAVSGKKHFAYFLHPAQKQWQFPLKQ